MELYAYTDVNGVSISGGRRAGENETVVDRLSHTKVDRGVSLVPSLSATQEFSVQSNLYAQYGRVGGGVTSIDQSTVQLVKSSHGLVVSFGRGVEQFSFVVRVASLALEHFLTMITPSGRKVPGTE